MARKTYKSPIFFGGLTPEDDPIIVINDSQDTSGYDSQWDISGIDPADQAMIVANCGDFELKDMDTDGNYIITQAEFDAWYDANEPW